MGRHAKDDAQQIGPRLWARFLKWHFGCSSLTPLNAQLLFPVTPFEEFEFGENPVPLPARIAPKVFERAYNAARRPDGSYTSELHNAKLKFNLYERVTQRVPASKYWLFKELDHFFSSRPPAIDVTVRALRQVAADVGLWFPEGNAAEAWANVDKNSVLTAERRTLSALGGCPLPECVTLAFLLCHLSIWNEPPQLTGSLPSRLVALCWHATCTFVRSLDADEFDVQHDLREELIAGFTDAMHKILADGMRSASVRKSAAPPDLVRYLVLVPDTPSTREATQCLAEAAELHGDPLYRWRYSRARAAEFYGKRVHTTTLAPSEAAAILAEASTKVSARLAERAAKLLVRYQPKRSGQRHRGRQAEPDPRRHRERSTTI